MQGLQGSSFPWRQGGVRGLQDSISPLHPITQGVLWGLAVYELGKVILWARAGLGSLWRAAWPLILCSALLLPSGSQLSAPRGTAGCPNLHGVSCGPRLARCSRQAPVLLFLGFCIAGGAFPNAWQGPEKVHVAPRKHQPGEWPSSSWPLVTSYPGSGLRDFLEGAQVGL